METPDFISFLKDRFPHVAGAYSDETLQQLQRAYSEKQRDYHAGSHIMDLLQKLDARRHLAKRPDLIAHAILWHDVVYSTNEPQDGKIVHRPDALNVDASAKLFRATNCKLSPEDRAEVEAMVRATDGHTLGELSAFDPHYKDRALFLDLDLSVLAMPADEFRANTARIRKEYPHVTDHAFCTGRADFFDKYGQKEVLFYHPATAVEFDTPARANMKRAAIELRQQAARLVASGAANRPAG